MAAEKNITSRIQQKHDTAANWAKATTFIPKKGEIVVYDAEYNTSGAQTQAVRFKIGDGSRTINNLPFALIDYDTRIASLESTVNGLGTAAQKDVGFFATAAQGTKADNAVPKTRKVNNKALSADITLGASDVGVNETAFPGLKKTGTITGIKMNNVSKGTSGVVDLGTVITAHQDISGKQDIITESNKLSASLVSGLATVATSGSYNDLSDRPAIPTDTGATSVEVTGAGNAVTAASYNATNRKLTLTKGSTFLTSHQDISGLMPKSGGTFSGDVTMSPGHLKTNLIKSADGSQWIAEITNNGLELGGSGYGLYLYSNKRPVAVVAQVHKELAYISDIPTFELSGDTLIINF